MNSRSIWNALLPVALVGAWDLAFVQRVPKAKQQLRTISLCELTGDWKKYDHTTVRIEAIFRLGPEVSDVYDSNCPNSENAAWAELPSEVRKATPQDAVEHLNRLIRSDGRARVFVLGEFDGPKKVEIPPNTPEKVAVLMQEMNSRYGHQNRWRFQFVISKIEKVQPVVAAEPWPRWTSEKKQ